MRTMADGKWIHGLTPTTPLAEAARRVLTARLEVIAKALPLAAQWPDEDVEHIHQLRVATRRTAEALQIFDSCLPKKLRKRTRKAVKRIRRAAGDARDWDVFQIALADWAQKRSPEEQPGLDFLRGYAFQRRQRSQGTVAVLSGQIPDAAKVAQRVRKPRRKGTPKELVDLAMPWLTDAVGELNEELRSAGNDMEHLHRLRILGKRLRYAMEVFADCFPSTFRLEWYPAVEEMQEILGHINDCNVALQRLVELRDQLHEVRPGDWPRLRLGIERWMQSQRRRVPQLRQKFVQWCDHWHTKSVPLAESLLQTRLSPVHHSPSENSCPPESPKLPALSNGSAEPTATSG